MANLTAEKKDSYTHHTRRHQFVEAAGIRLPIAALAKRRNTIVFNMPLYRDNDHWDPRLRMVLAANGK